MIDRAVERGADRAALLAAAGPLSKCPPETPVPLVAVFATWEAAMRAVRDPALPIAFARAFALEHYPVLGFATMTAPTGREAVARVVRFGEIVGTSGRWAIEERDDVARLVWSRPGPRTLGHRVANDSAFSRAFKRWTGRTPGDARREGGSGARLRAG
jgi:hypothetical protein